MLRYYFWDILPLVILFTHKDLTLSENLLQLQLFTLSTIFNDIIFALAENSSEYSSTPVVCLLCYHKNKMPVLI